MPQHDPKPKKGPEAIPAGLEVLSPDELNKLKRDVLRRSVDEKREAGELAKELKDLAPMAAALIIGILLESLKEETSEEPEKAAPSKPVPGKVEGAEAKTEAKEEPKEPEKEEPAKPKAVVRKPEVQNASDIVVIGDSIPKGMISKFRKGKKPDFIGEVGKSTPAILTDVRNNREKLKGKRTAIISCGVNDLVWNDNYEQITGNIEKMVKECDDAGVEEIIVLTHFPYQSDLDRTRFKGKATDLREVMLRRFTDKRHVKVVDIYKHFVDEKGNLKKKYAGKGKDKLHPYKAYKDALKIISRESGTDLEGLIV